MDNTLLRTDPAKLAIGDQVAPSLAPVSGQLIEVFADDERGNEGDGGADDLIATADCEGLSGVLERT